MTLIAGISPEGVPILLGDILLAGGGFVDVNFAAGHNEIVLPATGVTTIQPCLKTGERIVSVAQKICRIDKRLHVAWTGDYEAARRIISIMRRKAAGGYYSIDKIKSLFTNALYDDLEKISLIALFLSRKTNLELHCIGEAIDFGSTRLGRCFAMGSGATTLAAEIENMYGEQEFILGGKRNSGNVALSTAIVLAGLMTGNQASSGLYLDKYFGGIFEIAYPNGNSIQKLNSVTYMYWIVGEDGRSITLNPLVIKTFYYRDNLVVYRRIATPITSQEYILSSWVDEAPKMFIVSPLYQEAPLIAHEIEKCMRKNFNSLHYCHYILWPERNRAFVCAALFDGDKHVRFLSRPSPDPKFDKAGIHINSKLTDILLSVVNAERHALTSLT